MEKMILLIFSRILIFPNKRQVIFMHYRKSLNTLFAVTATLGFCSAANAQFEGLLKTLEKAAKQVEQPQSVPQNGKAAQSPAKSVAAPAYMSKADWDDLYEHSDDPAYLRKFEGRPVLISGEISFFDQQYTIGTGDEVTGTAYSCKSVVGTLPRSGKVKVEAQLADPYVEAGEDGSAVFLKNCRIANVPR